MHPTCSPSTDAVGHAPKPGGRSVGNARPCFAPEGPWLPLGLAICPERPPGKGGIGKRILMGRSASGSTR